MYGYLSRGPCSIILPCQRKLNINPESKFITPKRSVLIFILLEFLIIGYVYFDFLVLNKYFLFKDIGSDTINYAYTNFIQISRYLRQSGIPGWAFNQGIGQNIYPFMLGEPFANILYIAGENHLHKAIIYVEACKILLGGFFFYLFLLKIKINPTISIVGAIMFSMSSYMILGGSWYQFSTEAVYAALLLYSYEKYLQDNNPLLLPIPFALIASYQPFNLYWYGLLIILYAMIRTREFLMSRKFFKHVSIVTGFGFLGAFIAGIFILPNLHQYIYSSRVLGESSQQTYLTDLAILSYVGIVEFLTVIARLFSNDLLGNGNLFSGWDNYLESPMLYTGLISILLFPQYIAQNLKNKKKIIILLCLFLPFIFPYFRYALWLFTGNYYRTYSFIVSMMLLIGSLKALDKLHINKTINFKILFYTFCVLSCGLFVIFLSKDIKVTNNIAFLIFGLLSAYTAIIFAIMKRGAPYLLNGMLIIIIIEAAFFAKITISDRIALTPSDFEKGKNYKDLTLDGLNEIHLVDKGFFRITKDYFSNNTYEISYNDSKVQNYYGISSYNSFNQWNYVRFLDRVNVIDANDTQSTIWIKGPNSRLLLLSLLGAKYYFAMEPISEIGQMYFKNKFSIKNLTVYENENVLPLGFAYTRIAAESDHQKLSSFQKDVNLLKLCILSDQDFEQFKKSYNSSDIIQYPNYAIDDYSRDINILKEDSFNTSYFSDNYINGNISLDIPGILFFSIPFDDGWKILVNDQIVKPLRINYGFMGIPLDSGEYSISLKFFPPWLWSGCFVSLISLIVYLYLIKYFRRKNESN